MPADEDDNDEDDVDVIIGLGSFIVAVDGGRNMLCCGKFMSNGSPRGGGLSNPRSLVVLSFKGSGGGRSVDADDCDDNGNAPNGRGPGVGRTLPTECSELDFSRCLCSCSLIICATCI